MKIYRFNPETGVYLGEDFADDSSLEGGVHKLVDDATTIPPPKVKGGEVPVFHPETGEWTTRQLDRENPGMEKTGRPADESGWMAALRIMTRCSSIGVSDHESE